MKHRWLWIIGTALSIFLVAQTGRGPEAQTGRSSDAQNNQCPCIDLVKFRPEALGWHFRRPQEFVAGLKNRAWHNKKVKREYGINKIFVFHRFFRDGVCPAGAISKTTPIDQ